jgi:hypothetical protein
MNKADITSQLNSKYNELYPQYWEILMKKKEEPNNKKISEIFDNLRSNIDYLETYLSLIEIEDKEEMKIALERNNYLKELSDVLYEQKETVQPIYNSKIEIVQDE